MVGGGYRCCSCRCARAVRHGSWGYSGGTGWQGSKCFPPRGNAPSRNTVVTATGRSVPW